MIVFDVGASGFVAPAFSVGLPAYLSGNSDTPSAIAVAPP
jgi:hypothetical protein